MTAGPVTTNPQSARFQWLAAPLVSPGSCGICGKATFDKGFVNTGLDFEFFGTLIFCAECALNIGAPVGGLTPDEYTKLVETADKLAIELEKALNRIKELEAIEDAINHYNSRDGSDSNSSDSVRELVQPEELNEPDEVSTESDSLPTEPTVEQRSDDSSDVTGGTLTDDFLANLGIAQPCRN